MIEDIDFVVLWVNGNDPKWLNDKRENEKNINFFQTVVCKIKLEILNCQIKCNTTLKNIS